MSHYYQTNAITLSRQDARENDRVFSFYTEHLGKVLAQVTSAKKIKSRLSGHLEPFGVVEIGVVRGFRKNRLASAQARWRFNNIMRSEEKIFCAGYCLRLIDELVREGMPDNRIFYLLSSCLAALDEKNINENIKIFNAIFTLKLLSYLGYQPHVQNCIICLRPLSGSDNVFSTKRGGIQCTNCVKDVSGGIQVSCDDIKLLRLALGIELENVFKIKAGLNVYKKFNAIVAGFLKFHL